MNRKLCLLILSLISTLQACAGAKLVHPAITGTWVMTIMTNDAGALKVVMQLDALSQHNDTCDFTGYSEKDTDKKIFGAVKAGLGRIMGSNFKDGSLIRMDAGQLIRDDSVSAILVSPLGNRYMNGKITGNCLSAVLTDAKGQVTGQVTGLKEQPVLPLRNYKALWKSIDSLTLSKLYDPSLLKEKEWISFSKEMKRVCAFANDDAALMVAFFYYRNKLPFTHFYLQPETGITPVPDKEEETERFTQLEDKEAATGYLRITSFSGTASEMDSIFQLIHTKNYKNLVVDLRGNTGGALEAGASFSGHLVKDTLYGGVLLTQKYFARHRNPPTPETYGQFPYLSEANNKLLYQGISEYPGICLVTAPREPVYKGSLYILTDGYTASTCEPIVYGLKQSKRAVIVGHTTAGAMLNGEAFAAGNGFKITIPTATYYTPDGLKLDKNGVAPDIEVKEEDAFEYVMKKIKQDTGTGQ